MPQRRNSILGQQEREQSVASRRMDMCKFDIGQSRACWRMKAGMAAK